MLLSEALYCLPAEDFVGSKEQFRGAPRSVGTFDFGLSNQAYLQHAFELSTFFYRRDVPMGHIVKLRLLAFATTLYDPFGV